MSYYFIILYVLLKDIYADHNILSISDKFNVGNNSKIRFISYINPVSSGVAKIELDYYKPICLGKKDYIPSFDPSAALDDSPKCVSIPRVNLKHITGIFHPETEVKVKIGNGDIVNGHNNDYNLYALDFEHIAGSTAIYASDDGIAYLYNNCFERDKYNSKEKRFHGLGTHIRIAHRNYGTVYAHLDSYTLKNKAKVKKGQLIGYMRNNGTIHFSLHEIDDLELFKVNSIITNDACHDHSYTTQSAILTKSIPFFINIKYEDEDRSRFIHSFDLNNKIFTVQ